MAQLKLEQGDGRAPLLAIVLPGLGAGGTERVVNILANGLVARGWRVALITFSPPGTASYYDYDSRVDIRQLGLPPGRRLWLGAAFFSVLRFIALRGELKRTRADAVLSFLTRTNILTLLASFGSSTSVVVSERNNPVLQHPGLIWDLLRKALYPRAYGLVTMTEGALKCFPRRCYQRSWVIPNPVELPSPSDRQFEGPVLGAVGRLVPQKGFDLLLEAFAQVASEFPEWRLVIWGEGPDRSELVAQRNRLGLQNRVEFPGVSSAPGEWIASTDVFVLSSRFEGWGIVLLEAMAAGRPVVSFDCDFGPREMIRDGENGIIVPLGDVDALASALRRVLEDPELRRSFGAAAAASSERFKPDRVVDQWLVVARAIQQQTLHNRRGTRSPLASGRKATAASAEE